jgi:hypothetical protein
MKLASVIAIVFLGTSAQGQLIEGKSAVLPGLQAPHRVILSGDSAKFLYEQLNSATYQDSSALNRVLLKTGKAIVCSLYVDRQLYGCEIIVSANGVVIP